MSKEVHTRRNIIVVGGGASGATAARSISAKLDASKFNLIVINPRPYSILYPATARLTVSDAERLEDRVFVPYDKLFHKGKGTFLQGKVTAIEKTGSAATGGHVILENGERVPFEILILGPGSIWGGPIAFPDDATKVSGFIADGHAALRSAKNVILVGGGAVGIEFAGEIKDLYPNTNVTIVQGDELVLNTTYPASFRQGIQRRLVDYGINLVLNDYVDDIPVSGDVTTRKGQTLKADLVLLTRGPRPNTAFIAASLGPESLSDRGLVKVRPTLQLLDHPDIFALGDVIDFPEQRQYAKATNHAAVVSSNVLATISGKSLRPYKGSIEMLVVTIGKARGGAYLDIMWGISLGDWFARLVKGKGLLIDELRPGLGY
ncbi:FAD/NAD(P)-binding domain-containing protein [Collybia nuda]|uniref:FAD/NAD(P)-binding domain-containing protein n=1 Tax=Collybia nuda TaxID=64659 RepID=A0A9P5YH88_9AGAR|nr:FAD/NAD(P)-binding domain-containing protein [Collybia nuda]